MHCHNVEDKRRWLSYVLADELKRTFNLPHLRVIVGMVANDAGAPDFSVKLYDHKNPHHRIPDAIVYYAKQKIREWCDDSDPSVRAILIPAHYVPEAIAE